MHEDIGTGYCIRLIMFQYAYCWRFNVLVLSECARLLSCLSTKKHVLLIYELENVETDDIVVPYWMEKLSCIIFNQRLGNGPQ